MTGANMLSSAIIRYYRAFPTIAGKNEETSVHIALESKPWGCYKTGKLPDTLTLGAGVAALGDSRPGKM